MCHGQALQLRAALSQKHTLQRTVIWISISCSVPILTLAQPLTAKLLILGFPLPAEDVKYTYDRAMSDTVPNSVGKSYLSFVESVNIVSDVEELKAVKAAGSDTTVFDVLNEGLEKPFTTIAADKYDVDADAGKYQVVHIRLTEQYPQQLVTLSAGQISIVCMDRIEEVNKGIDVRQLRSEYSCALRRPSTAKQGADHGVYFSGPYVLNYVDDYGSYLERNPGWNPEAEDAAKIRYV